MLSSSKEYIQALRDGNYLLFLEWPQFIKERYKDAATSSLNSDDLPSLLCFEWLNNDYCEDDAKKLALLSAVHDHTLRPLKGHLSFTVITMMLVVFQCMLYHKQKSQGDFLTKETMTKEQILKLMCPLLIDAEKSTFKSLLQQQEAIFQGWVKNHQKVDGTKVNTACKQIKDITDLRDLMQEFQNDLKAAAGNDKLKASRLSVVNRLSAYVGEQFYLTPTVNEEITKYVNQLRTMQPEAFEEVYLNRLVPLSLLENTWKFGANIAFSVFAYLQPTPAQKPTPVVAAHPVASAVPLLTATIADVSKDMSK